jgi:hypothetical protein
MKIRVNGKDHALSSGPQVALPGLLRDRLMLIGMKKSHNRQYMTNAGTETGTPTLPFLNRTGRRGTDRLSGGLSPRCSAIRLARATSCPGA